MNEVTSCHVGNAFHEKFWCHQQTEGCLNSSSHYTGSSRLVTILKVLDAPIQVPNIFDLRVCFKFFNFSSFFLFLECPIPIKFP